MRRAMRGDHKEFQLDKNRSVGSKKESPKTKYTLEYMRKPVGSLDLSTRHISTNTLSTQISTESPTSVHYTKYGSSPGVGSIVSVNPSYLNPSSFIPPPEYSEVANGANSNLKSGIYVGSISEEENEISDGQSSEETSTTAASLVVIN